MNLSSAVRNLYTNKWLVQHYNQNIIFNQGLYIDGTYIDHIKIMNNMIIITFPNNIDIVANIMVIGGSYKIECNGNIIKDDVVNIMKNKNTILTIYDIKDYNKLIINFDVYLFKNKLKSAL